MRRLITRALCTLSLGGLLAIGVGVTAAAADTPSAATSGVSSTSSTSGPTSSAPVAAPSGPRMQANDWWM